jgi:hypothetical protein
MQIIWAIVVGAVLAALIDEFTANVGVKNAAYIRNSRSPAQYGLSLGFALVSAAAFVLLAHKLGQIDLRGGLKLATMIWAIAPLPMLLSNHFSQRLNPGVTLAYGAIWLAKLLVISGATALLL